MIIRQFIDAGWYTAPMYGTIKRDIRGKKVGFSLKSNWNVTNKTTFNTEETSLAQAFLGKISNIVALDCDNQETYSFFRSLDPTNLVIFPSKGKPQGGGTIIYSYNDELPSFTILGGDKCLGFNVNLEYSSDNSTTFLPTEDNFSKEPWTYTELPAVKELPCTILAILRLLYKVDYIKDKLSKADSEKAKQLQSDLTGYRLAPLLNLFVQSGEYQPDLFTIITPKSFRNKDEYIKNRHLNPKNLVEGEGSEYLMKVSAILGADVSVSADLYSRSIQAINSLWKDPISLDKLYASIINPMIDGKSKINGMQIWRYNPKWEFSGFVAIALNGSCVESFFDDIRNLYFCVNYSDNILLEFQRKSNLITYLRSMMGTALTELEYDKKKKIIRTILDPKKSFGAIEGEQKFNLFKQNTNLAILNNHLEYKGKFNKPTITLKYLETLIPDEFIRNFVLSFIKTKLTTFKFSSNILYFVGINGSGKDLFVNLLSKIIGEDYISRPDTKVFLENQNAWLLDKYFVHLDEYGDKLKNFSKKEEVIGRLKSYTGNQFVQIRAMNKNAFNYTHSATFITTANRNPLPLELDDRRIVLICTPNKLATTNWVSASGGITHVVQSLFKELPSFCYYLAESVPTMNEDDFVMAPLTIQKQQLLLDSVPAAERIVAVITRGNYTELENMLYENGITGYANDWNRGKLILSTLGDLYSSITNNKGNLNTIIKSLRLEGYTAKTSVANGRSTQFYMLKDLKEHKTVYEQVKDSANYELGLGLGF